MAVPLDPAAATSILSGEPIKVLAGLLVLSLTAGAILLKLLLKAKDDRDAARAACDAIQKEMLVERLAEKERIAVALTQSMAQTAASHVSDAAMTATLDKLAQAFAVMAQATESHREIVKERLDRIDRFLEPRSTK